MRSARRSPSSNTDAARNWRLAAAAHCVAGGPGRSTMRHIAAGKRISTDCGRRAIAAGAAVGLERAAASRFPTTRSSASSALCACKAHGQRFRLVSNTAQLSPRPVSMAVASAARAGSMAPRPKAVKILRAPVNSSRGPQMPAWAASAASTPILTVCAQSRLRAPAVFGPPMASPPLRIAASPNAS